MALISVDGSALSFTRYSPSGSLDLTYGTSGTSTIMLPSLGVAPSGIAAAADGSVLFAMALFNSSFPSGFRWQPAVLRVTPSGALDTTFGTNGYSMFYPVDRKGDRCTVIANGTILVGGRVGDNKQTYDNFFVARLLANGSLDPSFGTSAGMTVVDFGGVVAYGRKLAIQSNGKIVLVGGVGQTISSGRHSTRASFASTPTDRSTRPSVGAACGYPLNTTGGLSVALQNNDKIVITYSQWADAQQTQTVAAVARFTASGQLDTVFGSGGVSVIAPPAGFTMSGGGGHSLRRGWEGSRAHQRR